LSWGGAGPPSISPPTISHTKHNQFSSFSSPFSAILSILLLSCLMGSLIGWRYQSTIHTPPLILAFILLALRRSSPSTAINTS